MITRRAFLKYTGGTALTLFGFQQIRGSQGDRTNPWWITRPTVCSEVRRRRC